DVADWLRRKGVSGEYFITPMSGNFSSDKLFKAIEEISRHTLKKLPDITPPSPPDETSLAKGRSVAVFSLVACPRDEQLRQSAGLLADLLATDIEQSLSMKLVEREKLENILAEKKLQFAGLAERNQAILAARLLGADHLLTGSLVRAGTTFLADVQLLDVATGAIVATASADTTAEKLLETHRDLARALSRRVGPGLQRLSRLGPSPADWRTAEAQIHARWAERLIELNTERDAPFIAQVRG
ncbi:unnamed protein product, partial [marine sediment metagenome]